MSLKKTDAYKIEILFDNIIVRSIFFLHTLNLI